MQEGRGDPGAQGARDGIEERRSPAGDSWLRASSWHRFADAGGGAGTKRGRERERGDDIEEKEEPRDRKKKKEKKERKGILRPEKRGRDCERARIEEFRDCEGDRGLYEYGTANAYELSVYVSSRRSAETLRSMHLVRGQPRGKEGGINDRSWRFDLWRMAKRRGRTKPLGVESQEPSAAGSCLAEVVNLRQPGAAAKCSEFQSLESERDWTLKLNRDVWTNPCDVDAWLRLARGNIAQGRNRPSTAIRRGLALKSQAILERALEANPGNELLLLELMRNGTEIMTTMGDENCSEMAGGAGTVLDRYLDGVVLLAPNSGRLWQERIAIARANPSTASTSRVFELHRQALDSLNGAVFRGTCEQSRSTESHLILIFLSLVALEVASGRVDLGFARLQASLMFAFESDGDEARMMMQRGALKQFWDSGCPRIGEEGATERRWCGSVHQPRQEDDAGREDWQQKGAQGEPRPSMPVLAKFVSPGSTGAALDDDVRNDCVGVPSDDEERVYEDDVLQDYLQEFDVEALRAEIGLKLREVDESTISPNTMSRWLEREETEMAAAMASRSDVNFDDVGDTLLYLCSDESKIEFAIRAMRMFFQVDVPDDRGALVASAEGGPATFLTDDDGSVPNAPLDWMRAFQDVDQGEGLGVPWMTELPRRCRTVSRNHIAANLLRFIWERSSEPCFLVPLPHLQGEGEGDSSAKSAREASKGLLSVMSTPGAAPADCLLRLWAAHIDLSVNIKSARKACRAVLDSFGGAGGRQGASHLAVFMLAAAEMELRCAGGSAVRALQLLLSTCGDHSVGIGGDLETLLSSSTLRFVHAAAAAVRPNAKSTQVGHGGTIDVVARSILMASFLFELLTRGRLAALLRLDGFLDDIFGHEDPCSVNDCIRASGVHHSVERLVVGQLLALFECPRTLSHAEGGNPGDEVIALRYRDCPAPTPSRERALIQKMMHLLRSSDCAAMLTSALVKFDLQCNAASRLRRELSSSHSDGTIAPSFFLPVCEAELACLSSIGGSGHHGIFKIRKVLERHLERDPYNQLLWRWYLNFEAMENGPLTSRGNAKKVFYRAIARCPWSKSLWMDGFALLGSSRCGGGDPILKGEECAELMNLARSKGIEFHVDVYQVLLEEAVF